MKEVTEPVLEVGDEFSEEEVKDIKIRFSYPLVTRLYPDDPNLVRFTEKRKEAFKKKFMYRRRVHVPEKGYVDVDVYQIWIPNHPYMFYLLGYLYGDGFFEQDRDRCVIVTTPYHISKGRRYGMKYGEVYEIIHRAGFIFGNDNVSIRLLTYKDKKKVETIDVLSFDEYYKISRYKYPYLRQIRIEMKVPIEFNRVFFKHSHFCIFPYNILEKIFNLEFLAGLYDADGYRDRPIIVSACKEFLEKIRELLHLHLSTDLSTILRYAPITRTKKARTFIYQYNNNIYAISKVQWHLRLHKKAPFFKKLSDAMLKYLVCEEKRDAFLK